MNKIGCVIHFLSINLINHMPQRSHTNYTLQQIICFVCLVTTIFFIVGVVSAVHEDLMAILWFIGSIFVAGFGWYIYKNITEEDNDTRDYA